MECGIFSTAKGMQPSCGALKRVESLPDRAGFSGNGINPWWDTPGEKRRDGSPLLEQGEKRSRRFLADRPVPAWREPTRSLRGSSGLSANRRDDAFSPGLQLEGSHSNLWELG